MGVDSNSDSEIEREQEEERGTEPGSFAEKQMRQKEVDELEFGEIISETYGKRVAALAFVSPPNGSILPS